MKKEKEKDGNTKKCLWHILGGIAIAGGMCMILPKLIETASDYLYRESTPTVKPDDDTWGPEIVKKESLEDEDE